MKTALRAHLATAVLVAVAAVVCVGAALFPASLGGTLWVQVMLLLGLLVFWQQVREAQARAARRQHSGRTDDLTGLPNRRALTELLWALPHAPLRQGNAGGARHGGDGWSVLMIDLDLSGSGGAAPPQRAVNEVFRAVGASLRAQLRTTDALGRWDKGEYLALLPGSGVGGATVAAERLRQAVAAQQFPLVGRITLSIGVTSYRHGDSPDGLLGRAAAALERARQANPGRVAASQDASQSS
ncbi:GGDEF domain-containing protein [Deinococcus sp.]|uniref:GGDEF domain-containing protein n=1 Tax=Deinococcus sp. TaxID=47478 RepID=UPI003CC67F5A